MLKISRQKTFSFLRYGHVRYVTSLFTIIEKQQKVLKLTYFLRNLQSSRANNSRIIRIKNAQFAGYCFYMNTNILRDFQIYISVPLMVGLFSCQNQSTSKKKSEIDLSSRGFRAMKIQWLKMFEMLYLDDDDVLGVILMMRTFNKKVEIKCNYYFILTKIKSVLIEVSSLKKHYHRLCQMFHKLVVEKICSLVVCKVAVHRIFENSLESCIATALTSDFHLLIDFLIY